MRRATKEPIGRVTGRRLLPVLVLVPVLFILLLWQLRSVTLASESVDHTDRVVAQLHGLETLVFSLETGVRGYALTGDPSFLEPYEAGRRSIGAALDQATEMVSDNPEQLQRLGQVRREVDDWIAHAQTVTESTKRGENPAPLISRGRGDAEVNRIQTTLAGMIDVEETLRSARANAAHLGARVTAFVAGGSLVWLGVWLGLLLVRHRRWQDALIQSEHALRASEGRWRALFDHASEGIFIADPEGRFTDANPAACQMLGYARDELAGKKLTDLVPPEAVARLERTRLRLSTPGEVYFGEEALKDRTGHFVPVELSSKILPDGRWQAFIRDITEPKRIQAERQFLLDLDAALASGLDYQETVAHLAELLLSGNADGCVVDVQEDGAGIRRARVAVRDRAAKGIAEKLERLELGPGLRLTSAALETRRPVLVEEAGAEYVRSVTQSEEHFRLFSALKPSSVMALPLIAHGRVLGALAIFSSTPGHRYAQRDLRFAQEIASRAALALDNAHLYQEARRALAARDEILGVVAHDLRNPLNVIGLQADLLRRREAAGPGDRLPKQAETIHQAAARMERIIEDLLDVVRLESGHLSVAQRRTVTLALLAQATAAQEALAAAGAIALRVDAPPGLPDVWGDRDRLLQVFENLIGNAVKFTGPGGSITVGAGARDGEVLFWVADTGRGLAPPEIPHLFDRFWQATQGERRGAGLGLSIVKGIIEAHHGRIWVESTLGKGSVFFFTLPAAGPPAEGRTEVAPTA